MISIAAKNRKQSNTLKGSDGLHKQYPRASAYAIIFFEKIELLKGN